MPHLFTFGNRKLNYIYPILETSGGGADQCLFNVVGNEWAGVGNFTILASILQVIYVDIQTLLL